MADNLRIIKDRMQAIGKTVQIVNAMRLTAASKIKKFQAMFSQMFPYTQLIENMLNDALYQVQEMGMDLHSELIEPRPQIKRVGISVSTSDQGFVGGYNTAVIKEAMSLYNKFKAEDIEPIIYCLGQKAVVYFGKQQDINSMYPFVFSSLPTDEEIRKYYHFLIEQYHSGQVDAIYLIGQKYLSLGVQQFATTKWLPLTVQVDKMSQTKKSLAMDFDPSPKEVLDQLIKLHLLGSLSADIFEAKASEQMARIQSTSVAKNNAEDILGSLKIKYNRGRQAAVTQELIEIVSGTSLQDK